MIKKVFNIERVSGSEHKFEYMAMVIDNHKIFDGHFPQAPIVPGVCSIGMIKQCVEDAISHSVQYKYIKECKFLGTIVPSEHKKLNVSLTLKHESDLEINVTAEVSYNGTKMMKLKATVI